MLKSFVDAISKLARPQVVQVGDETFSNDEFFQVGGPKSPPVVQSITVRSVTGFVDFCNSIAPDRDEPANVGIDIPDSAFLICVSPDEIKLMSGITENGSRLVFARAIPLPSGFETGRWMRQDHFIVAVMEHFEDTDSRSVLLRIAGTLKAENIRTSADDGISQSVTVRKTASGTLTRDEEIKNPFMLRARLTFPEIDQPEKAYILRVSDDGKSLALFATSDQKWQLDVVVDIKSFIEGRLNNLYAFDIIG